uniref:Uncharacterized protein n=1 Tax=Utricularia reniformis TaxID=192314 RepID=A0A1Y0AZV6_9LAMI|nr:hypothetical protein AEK19_MT0404 [Utricularia reniformis]ART30673.1 hypothetical protein AEK19_MT0404 [Utricularia reniformis]
MTESLMELHRSAYPRTVTSLFSILVWPQNSSLGILQS